MNERVLIVSKTKMYDDACVGAVTESGESLRLLGALGEHQARNTLLDVGQIWIIAYNRPPADAIEPPHIEDVFVTSQRFEKQLPTIKNTLIKMFGKRIWCGSLETLFDGSLAFTSRGSGYISHETGIPDRSTWYWYLDQDMVADERENKIYYHYRHDDRLKIKYVGFAPHRPQLKKHTLLRLSLARWWNPPDADTEERCYLQLSGWYI